MATPFEMEQKLQYRLEQSRAHKNIQLETINRLQAELQKLYAKSIKRPRDSLAELDAKINALERKRTSTSVPLAEERQILKDMSKIRKSKVEVEAFLAHDKAVQERKAQLNEIRDSLKLVNSGITEMDADLAQNKLANKLGCLTQDLTTITVEVSKEKIGSVIGKNGARMKEIMELTKVTMDVKKEEEFNTVGGGKIRTIVITGNVDALAKAVAEIDKITMSVEEQFAPSIHLLTYLTARNTNDVMDEIKAEFADLFLEVSRNTKNVILRGMPDRVAAAKGRILGLNIVTKERVLKGRDVTILVGRKGGTIEKLSSDHKVSIGVDKKDGDDSASKALITGPPDRVEAAMNEIDALMNDNRDATENISVNPIVKRILLADNGKHIKAMQTKVTEELNKESDESNKTLVFLSIEKESNDKDFPELLVRTKNYVLTIATELTEASLKEINQLVITISIDPYIIPRIIGKGGETIKKLTQGKHAFVEVDRGAGKLMVGATEVEERDNVLKEFNELIANNQLMRIDADLALIQSQFRELNRAKAIKAEISALAYLDIDETKGQFILRGNTEKCEKAKEILLVFLEQNHLQEIEVTEEDMEAMLSGGKQSTIMKLSGDLCVNLFADRSRHVIVVKGTKDKVKTAVDRVQQFVHGGNGHSVTNIAVTEQVIGVVIGKGGKTRQGLEEKHGGVSINISKTYRVSIRGPEDKVAECRVEILKMIASARVNQTVPVTEEQHAAMEKNGAMKRIMQAAPVQITVSGGTATLRGFFHDVRDAVSLLKEQLTGVYENGIELDPSQFQRVRLTCRDPSHFTRMESESSAKVTLDMATGTIVLSGKRNNVKKAKDLILVFLDFLLPGEFARVKITKPLYHSVGSANSLADVSANAGGAIVYLDRDLGFVVIRSSDPEKVKRASQLVGEKISEGEKLAYVLQFEPAEAWLMPVIIGKNGNRVQALEKETNCHIDVSKESRTVTVTGESAEAVAKVKASLAQLVDKARKECVFLNMPEAAMPKFVGKAGAHIKEFSATHKVDLQRQNKGPYQFRLTGEEHAVGVAMTAINEWVAKWEEANGTTSLTIEKNQVPVIIGNKGETARAIQEEFGCRVDVDRKEFVVTLRNGDKNNREKAMEKIVEILAKAKEDAAAATLARAEAAAAAAAANPPVVQTAPVDAPRNRSRTSSNGSADLSLDDGRVDRTTEFPVHPVGGMTKQNGGKKKKKTKQQAAAVPDASIVHGADTGRSLFKLLIGG